MSKITDRRHWRRQHSMLGIPMSEREFWLIVFWGCIAGIALCYGLTYGLRPLLRGAVGMWGMA